MTASETPCRCGHPRRLHEHWRPATDCVRCGRWACPRFRHEVPLRVRVAAVLRRAVAR